MTIADTLRIALFDATLKITKSSIINLHMHTFAGSPLHLKLVHETSKLLSHSHSAQQALVIKEVLLTPLRALLMLWRSKEERRHGCGQSRLSP